MKKRLMIFCFLFSLIAPIFAYNDFYVAPGDTVTIAFSGAGINSFSIVQISDNNYLPIIIENHTSQQIFSKEMKYLTTIKTDKLTMKELEDSIYRTIKNFFSDANVSVMINSPRYIVSIIGNEGKDVVKLKYIKDFSVWDYIIRAEGFIEYGFIDNVVVISREGERTIINKDSLFIYKPLWGYTIYIPNQYVFVEGGVENPGAYPYSEGKNSLYYIGLSGGARGPDINIYRGYVLRADKKYPISENTIIHVNDRIIIPEPFLTVLNVIDFLIRIGLTIIPILLR